MINLLFTFSFFLILSACSNCAGMNCSREFSITLGNQFLTEDRVTHEVREVWGATDPFVGSQNQYQIDNNHFEVSTQNFEGFEATQQRSEWCWAAAVSMVLNYQGIDVDQCEVLRTLGRDCRSDENQLGSVNSIINALRGWKLNAYGRPAGVFATSLATGNGTPLIQDVATNWPPIVGLGARKDQPGHVYVLTEIEYSWMPGTWNVPVIWSVRLYDPWDGTYVRMRGTEFDELFDFAVRVQVRHL